MPIAQTKTVALFASKLGYQTRSFEAAAGRLGVELVYVTDRCHELNDPWGDHAIAARFANLLKNEMKKIKKKIESKDSSG